MAVDRRFPSVRRIMERVCPRCGNGGGQPIYFMYRGRMAERMRPTQRDACRAIIYEES
ncbi:MAG: hypothetical protein SPL86_12015 [Succiniclasticum sp.]|uniref:hypothetical protein n=1 Tax=Succiniclasticum sp. TaxID=2775030 RepID=UPI002A91D124|nr:hypothetical protein [Succiniclasticum sp.]MDY6292195.1 hypothetical protein [Succiniclasticum sp.]